MTADTPRQRRRIKNKAAILDAAAELIVAKGFENVSLRDIARQADYSPSGLYKYFDSKAAIIQALKVKENQKLLSSMGTIPFEIPADQRLIDLCLLYIRHCLDNHVYLTLMNALVSERKSKDQAVPEDSPYRVLLGAVQDWAHAENIPLQQEYGLEEIAYALWAQIHGMATLRLSQLRDFEADFESVNRRTLELFLKGLRD